MNLTYNEYPEDNLDIIKEEEKEQEPILHVAENMAALKSDCLEKINTVLNEDNLDITKDIHDIYSSNEEDLREYLTQNIDSSEKLTPFQEMLQTTRKSEGYKKNIESFKENNQKPL
jgi:hypothetical protein